MNYDKYIKKINFYISEHDKKERYYLIKRTNINNKYFPGFYINSIKNPNELLPILISFRSLHYELFEKMNEINEMIRLTKLGINRRDSKFKWIKKREKFRPIYVKYVIDNYMCNDVKGIVINYLFSK